MKRAESAVYAVIFSAASVALIWTWIVVVGRGDVGADLPALALMMALLVMSTAVIAATFWWDSWRNGHCREVLAGSSAWC